MSTATTIRVGIHLPHTGRHASPDGIARVARRAEELGFSDVWVSDHIVSPAEQDYPTPRILDPLLSLSWAAAATTTIGLGTSVLVVPQYQPLWLANALASLDILSGGRLRFVGGVGWSEREYDALGQGFGDRGSRMDEILDICRLVWAESPASFEGAHYRFRDIRVLPQPERRLPIWIGGGSEPAYRRGAARGDGFQALGLDIPGVEALVSRLRRDRPEPEFTISLRTGWDPQGMETRQILREHDAWQAAGLQHVVSAPWRRDADEHLRSMEMLADILGLTPPP